MHGLPLALLAASPLVLGMGVGWVLRDKTAAAYASLPDRPRWARPPAWVFGPVWAVLYALMGVAAWTAFSSSRGSSYHRGAALALYLVQLALNLAWAPVFFGAGKRREALWVLVALDAVVIAAIAAFARLSSTAAWLLVPYAAWLAYATALNAVAV